MSGEGRRELPLPDMMETFAHITPAELLREPMQRRAFLAFYKKCYGKSLCARCDSEIINHLYRHQLLIKQQPMTKERSYRLPHNALMMVHGVDPVSDHTLTDEKAEDILRKNPSLISSFIQYPADWQERVFSSSYQPSDVTDDGGLVDDTIEEEMVEEAVEEKVNASAAAKKLAQEFGLDISQLKGSGKGGNITKKDVEAALS